MGKVQMSAPPAITEEDWEYYLSFNPFEYILKTAEDIKKENRYFVDERFLKLIYSYSMLPEGRAHTYFYLMPSDGPFFRARIYKPNDGWERLEHPEKYGVFHGYDEKNSFVPPEGSSVESGRINPQNIRYLYTTSDVETSILEVRAKPSEFVSVATIRLLEPAIMFDVSKNYSTMWDSDNRKDEWFCKFYLALMGLFQKAYRETGDYYLCQYISEYLKNWGYDGIMFRSAVKRDSLNGGVNLTFFNYEKCKTESSELFFVTGMSVNTTPPFPRKEIKDDNEEDEKKEQQN